MKRREAEAPSVQVDSTIEDLCRRAWKLRIMGINGAELKRIMHELDGVEIPYLLRRRYLGAAHEHLRSQDEDET